MAYFVRHPEWLVVGLVLSAVTWYYLFSSDRWNWLEWASDRRRRQFSRALRDGNVSVLRRRIGAEPELINEPLIDEDMTPLSAACVYGQTAMVKWLRDHGASADDVATTNRSAIYLAYQQRIPAPRKRALVDAVCHKATAAELGQALCLAAHSGQLPIVVDLLQRGADVSYRNQFLGLGLERSPLMLALSQNHEAVARVLIANGANPFWNEKGSQRPLVTGGGLSTLIEAFIDRGWTYEDWDQKRNPLIFAIDRRDIAFVRQLVAAGALPWRLLSGGGTPWVYAHGEKVVSILDALTASPYYSLRVEELRRHTIPSWFLGEKGGSTETRDREAGQWPRTRGVEDRLSKNAYSASPTAMTPGIEDGDLDGASGTVSETGFK